MACPYRREIKNKRYLPNNENGGIPPEPIDERQRLVGVGCGKCAVCKRSEVANWRVRLQMELEYNRRKVHFVTMTLTDEKYMELINRDMNYEKEGYDLENSIIESAVKLWRQRMNSKGFRGEDLKYFLISELGGNNTERVHLHGLIWCDVSRKDLEDIWSYGGIWTNEDNDKGFVNGESISYMVKYMYKEDKKHLGYFGKRFMSKGLGVDFTKDERMIRRHRFKEERTMITMRIGDKDIMLPEYYRRKFWTKDQRALLSSYVCGNVRINGKDYVRNSSEMVRALDLAQTQMIEWNLIEDRKFNEEAYKTRVNRKRYLAEKKKKRLRELLKK